MIQDIEKAMQDYDNIVLQIDYTDTKGITTKRIISPYHFTDIRKTKFLALCLAREDIRMFKVDQISNLKLVDANTVQMPVEIE